MTEVSNKIVFKELSPESVDKIVQQIIDDKARVEAEKIEAEIEAAERAKNPHKRRTAKGKSPVKELDPSATPNKDFEIGKTLPNRFHAHFPSELYGFPIEEIDPYYKNKYVRLTI